MLNRLRNLSSAIEEIEEHLYDVTEEILKASGSHKEKVVLTRNTFSAKNPCWDIILFLMGKDSHIGAQLNGIFWLLDFLEKDVAFTVRHNAAHLHSKEAKRNIDATKAIKLEDF